MFWEFGISDWLITGLPTVFKQTSIRIRKIFRKLANLLHLDLVYEVSLVRRKP